MKQKIPLEHLYLVDGSGYIFRAFHALPSLTRPDGVQVGAVYGFCTMLLKLIETADADHLAVVFDSGRHTFRNDIYKEYKANRPNTPEELIPQFPLIRDACRAFNIPMVEMKGYEADDLIATYATQAVKKGAKVTIVSSDKDFMQLISDQIKMLDPLKNCILGEEQVNKKFGVGPDKVIEVQALAGDYSDNVPGVPGIGVKTAAALINHYGDLETLLQRVGEIKQPKRRQSLIDHKDDARISLELVTLKKDVAIEKTFDDFTRREPDPDTLVPFLIENSFKRLLARFDVSEEALSPLLKPPTEEDKRSYQLIQTEGALKEWITRAQKLGKVVVNTETTSLDPLQAKLVGISLSLGPGDACYIPLSHKIHLTQGNLALGEKNLSNQVAKQINFDKAIALLKILLSDPGILKIGQNIKYDQLVFSQHGVEIMAIDDITVLSYLLDGTSHGHSIDDLADLYLDRKTIKYKEVVGSGKEELTFDYVPLEKALEYACESAEITFRLHMLLKQRLVDNAMVAVYESMERPLISTLADIEFTGIKVDVDQLKRLSLDFGHRLHDLEIEIYKLAGRSFNIASPRQLGEVLFFEMGFKGGKKGKSGSYSTSADVLEKLCSQSLDLPKRVLEWRQLSKLKSTYTDVLIDQIDPKTGRVHTTYSMTVTSTGRLASSNPNLQNIPIRSEEGLKIRRAFVAAPRQKFMSFDYSQIELRLLAHVAQIEELKEAFHEGLDIHKLTASQVFRVPLEDVDDKMRFRAKAINFGIVYGISAFGLANQLDISNYEAAQHIKAYLQQYPGISRYMKQTKMFARKHGYVQIIFGRRCYITDINSRNPARQRLAERQAINAPLQGGQADIIKRAMVKVPDVLNKAGLKAKMLVQVHDELIFEVPEKEVEQTGKIVKEIMEKAAYLDVPLVVDVGVGDNWAET